MMVMNIQTNQENHQGEMKIVKEQHQDPITKKMRMKPQSIVNSLALRLMLKLISFPLTVIKHTKIIINSIVENYSEIDWFDFEMRMRKLVH